MKNFIFISAKGKIIKKVFINDLPTNHIQRLLVLIEMKERLENKYKNITIFQE